MQFVPDKPLSPFLRSADLVCLDPVFVPQPFDIGVGRHLPQGAGHAFRALHVQVAPPEDGFRPFERA